MIPPADMGRMDGLADCSLASEMSDYVMVFEAARLHQTSKVKSDLGECRMCGDRAFRVMTARGSRMKRRFQGSVAVAYAGCV